MSPKVRRWARARLLYRVLVLAVLLLAGWARAVGAQAVTCTILGTVTDASAAVVAAVKVTATHEGTGATREVLSDANGEYVMPSLPTGRYVLTAEKTGFKIVALSGIEVGVDQRVRINAKMEVGGVTESVSVTAETPLVQTSSSELGTTIPSTQIEALPLNGRNFVSLTRTVPGVLRGIPGSNIDGAGSLAWRASASFSANGQRARDNNFMLDGVDNNETWLQTVVIFPSVEALDEFKLQTSTYSAEFGRSLGGVVNLQIKSGTNDLRGSLFEFHRNDSLNAINFFDRRAGRAKPTFKQHQFGGTVGGRLVRDRSFFFFDYQGHREQLGQTFLSTVPSMKMRSGDFSELTRVVYDPLTNQPFPGNVIPSHRIDAVARAILTQLYNDTHMLSSRWLNEFRFGWSSVKFLMTPIDYGTHPAAAVGLPGINLNQATSAMTQLTFQNIRNLGANGNQPLITNQNDFQIFDNITMVRGRHTLKIGGSLTLRSREILNADTIVGQFSFNNNMTSNCAGRPAGCSVNTSTGFDAASFLLGYVSAKNRNLFDASTYTEVRPEYALYVQDDMRPSSKLTLNLGLRWDVYPPWVEVDDRQSNFDPSTGKFVVASPDAVIADVKVGRYLQT